MFFNQAWVGDVMEAAYQRLFAQIGDYYQFELDVPKNVDRPARWEIIVVDNEGKPWGKLTTLYSAQFVPSNRH